MQKAIVGIQMDSLWNELIEKVRSYNLEALEEEALLNIEQAKEYSLCLESISTLTSPLYLFYYMVSLGRIIFVCKKRLPFKEVLHGLTNRRDGLQVRVKAHGTFPTLHSIISGEKIKPGTTFGIEELLTMIPWVYYVENPVLPPISSSYLLGFLLSMLSRYEPTLWNTIRLDYNITLFLKETPKHFLEELIKVL